MVTIHSEQNESEKPKIIYMMNQKTMDRFKAEFEAHNLETQVNDFLEDDKVYAVEKDWLEEPIKPMPILPKNLFTKNETFEENKVTARYWELLKSGIGTRATRRKLKREFGPGYVYELNLPVPPKPQGLIAVPHDIESFRISERNDTHERKD